MNIATIRLKSKVLAMPTEVIVLMPEDARASKESMKILWLLHGAQCDDRTYLYHVDFADMLSKHRMLIVMPSALNSDYGNYERFGLGYDFPSYLFNELMPFIQKTFSGSEKAEDNFIEGSSMGDFGAMQLGLMHPDKFAAIGMLAASMRRSEFLKPYIDDPDCERFRKDALSDPGRFPTEYGNPEVGIKRKEVNVITKYPTIRDFYQSNDCMWNRFIDVAEKGILPKIYIACGQNDLFYRANVEIQNLCLQLGVLNQVCFDFPQGIAHSEEYFSEQIKAFADYCDI